MEQVIKDQVKKECEKIISCIYEESEGSICIYPYSQIVSSRLIKAIDMIKEEYAEMVDYYIGYDGLKREIFVSVEIHFNPPHFRCRFNPKEDFFPFWRIRK